MYTCVHGVCVTESVYTCMCMHVCIPSLISLVVSVDVKHHVYLLTCVCVHAFVCVIVYAHVCMCECVCACMHVCVCVCMDQYNALVM